MSRSGRTLPRNPSVSKPERRVIILCWAGANQESENLGLSRYQNMSHMHWVQSASGPFKMKGNLPEVQIPEYLKIFSSHVAVFMRTYLPLCTSQLQENCLGPSQFCAPLPHEEPLGFQASLLPLPHTPPFSSFFFIFPPDKEFRF